MTFRGADLHGHSTASDGLLSPREYAAAGAAASLEALALTDHDSVAGHAAFAEACRALGLAPVIGTELSVLEGSEEVHLLGLFVDPLEPGLRAALETFRALRETRGEAMVERLAAAGMPLDVEAVRASADGGSLGRPHVARALVAAGFAASVDDAFDRFLGRGKPGYVPKRKWSLSEAIGAVKRAGGLAVLAHPVWSSDAASLVARAAAAGLDGLEAGHPDQPGDVEGAMRRLARRHGLLVTAGSDHHGPGEAGAPVGTHRLGREEWDRVVSAARARRAEAGRPPLDGLPSAEARDARVR